MSYPIKTNQIIATFNYSKIDENYEIYKMSNENSFSKSAYILDSPLTEKSVLSVCYTYGKSFYVLLKRDINNKELIRTIIERSKKANDLTFEQIESQFVYKNVLLQLFLNSICAPKNKYLSFNNLTGHLYVFNPLSIKRRKFQGADTICQIPCIDVRINNDLTIHLNVRTFTSLKYKKQLGYDKINDLPKYVLSFRNTFRRKLNEDKEDTFVIRQFPNKKNEISFLDFQNNDKFLNSKVGLLNEIVKSFNELYFDYISISFKEISEYKSIDYTSLQNRENDKIIKSCLNKKDINIVDLILDKYSDVLINNIIELFKNKYDLKVKKGKQVSSKNFNICVIHNKDYYNGVNDPHDIEYKGKVVQHITLEDFQDNAVSAISTIVHEILIKEDLANKKITLFDWDAMGFDSKITFGQNFTINGVERYFFMDIEKDGSFDIQEQKLDLFNINEYSDLTHIFSDNSKCFEKVKGLVKDSNGNINIIRDTMCFTLPEMEKIKQELDSGNTYLRSKEKREELISACTDIKYYEENNKGYYFSGVIGNGMRAKIADAANIRKVEAYNKSDLFFEKLMPLMSVKFVRNNQLTVIPFPFKYLREYINKELR